MIFETILVSQMSVLERQIKVFSQKLGSRPTLEIYIVK